MDFIAGLAAFAPLLLGQADGMPTPRELYDRVPFPPLEYEVQSDEIIDSLTDPDLKLRRIDLSFVSQVHQGVRMDQTVTIFMPADPRINATPERRGKVVIVGQRRGDEPVLWNYGEPIAARTGYPTTVIDVPGAFDGKDGEGRWIRHTSDAGRASKDVTDHNYFRLAACYIRAMDLFEEILEVETVRAVIGGHSKRATSAYTAAAIDPERVAGVVYMGNESTFEVMDADYRAPLSPHRAQAWVACPVLYIGATNEDGYEMFSINHIQSKMTVPWAIQYTPNYRHASNSEKQFMDWQMWVSHVFDGRPLTRIGETSHEITARGLTMRAKIESPNKIIQVKFWYAYCDDVPFWRDLVWYPVYNVKESDGVYEGYNDGKTPDAWLVEVKDVAMGFTGYLSSLPQKVSDKETAVRKSRGSRSRHWEPNK